MPERPVPDLGAVAVSDPAQLQRFLETVREIIQTREGRRGTPLQKGVTYEDLSDLGLITRLDSGRYSGVVQAVPGPAGPPGPPGSPAPAPTPDLTAPPAAVFTAVTAGFSVIFVEWVDPVYAAGGGHAHTEVWAAVYSGAGPLPTFANAELVSRSTAPLFAFPAGLGVQVHFWLVNRTKADVPQATPTGGTNGWYATTGKIGHSDLGPLIIEADNLASGAVTAAKLAAQAVELTKFADGIEPVHIVTAGPLPTSKITTAIIWTDGKLYRWTGSAYTKAVDAADITVGQLTAGQIAAGAIGTSQLAAGAVTAGKLLVTGAGAALNVDPQFTDAALDVTWPWYSTAGSYASTRVLDSTGPAGQYALEFVVDNGSSYASRRSALFPIAQGKRYRVSFWARRTSGAATSSYVRLHLCDSNGAALGSPSEFVVTAEAPWAGAFEAFSVPTEWTRFRGYLTVPGGYAALAFLEVWGSYLSGPCTVRFQDVRCEEYIGADLIVDGAISATKIAAGAIAVGSAAIADGAIRNALIENGAITTAKIADAAIVTAKIGDAQITNAKIASLDAGKITTGTLDAERIAAGSITASKIDARGLSILDAIGNVIVAAGSAVDWSKLGGSAPNLAGLGYTGDLNATRGAPAGTMVGSVAAESVESTSGAQAKADAAQNNAITTAAADATTKANNAQSTAISVAAADATAKADAAQNAAIAHANSGLAGKLNKAGADILTGPINLNAATAILVGTTNDGLYLGNTGIVGRKAGVTTFAVDQAGNAIFAGELQAATGSFTGSISINGATWSNTVSGFWTGMDGGLAKLRIGDASQYLKWTGTSLEIKLNRVELTANSPSTNSFPKNDGIVRTLGTVTVTASGGTPPYSYAWSMVSVEIDSAVFDADNSGSISPSGSSCAFLGRGDTDCGITVSAVCTVTDSNGLTATITRGVTGFFGNGPP